jgi:hypothetical protein
MITCSISFDIACDVQVASVGGVRIACAPALGLHIANQCIYCMHSAQLRQGAAASEYSSTAAAAASLSDAEAAGAAAVAAPAFPPSLSVCTNVMMSISLVTL